ncbi:MAG TPA: IS630 family transposase [Chloroflexota bacterium]|nr:IS630 family transposase [Chloroflexota bacterium]
MSALPPHTVVLFEDETILRELPPLRCCWAKRGERAVVPITGNNARRCIFGVLNPRTGARLCSVRHRNRGEDFRSFLHEVRARYRRWPICLILDQASSHTAKITQLEAERLRIELAWLPTACPELNPNELLWSKGKQNVSANRTFETVDQQARAFVQYLLALTPTQARKASGVMSPNFWLPA